MTVSPSYYFFSYRPAIRYHIARCLKERGWVEAENAQSADLSDKHLTLNDEISLCLEYKDNLAALVKRYCPDVMPITYCINDDTAAQVFAQMIYEHYLINQQYVKTRPDRKWILKPATLNNGDAIYLFNNVEEIKQHYASNQRLGGAHVIQRYIQDPDLIEGRKYTFRIHIVLTNYAGAFMYNQGYVNISAQPFTQDFSQRKVHITNYVLDGELAYIEQRSTQVLPNFAPIYQQMQQIAQRVIKGLVRDHPRYLKPRAYKSFEIFGLDFMLDHQQKLWLLEINQGPDAPTFEENRLNEVLWEYFWPDIIDDFVYPVALNQPPTTSSGHFVPFLSQRECYSWWRGLWG